MSKIVNKNNKIKSEFEGKSKVYESLRKEAELTPETELKKSHIEIHSIPSRVKKIDSFLKKVERKNYKKPFEQVEDVVALRVIGLFLSDIERIGNVIRNCFNIIKEDDKIDNSELSSFGYMSVHFIAKFGSNYSGTRYNEIKDQVFEIQVRTIAMDAWANISHHLDYKTNQDIPKELKRDFYALSGMFYVADKHFQLFFEKREKKQDEIVEVYKRGNDSDINSQAINLDTLSAYLQNKFPSRIHSNSEYLSLLISELKDANFNFIGDIEKLVDYGMEAFLVYEKQFVPDSGEFKDVGAIRNLLDITSDYFLKKRCDRNSQSVVARRKELEPFRTLLPDKRN